MDAFSSIVKMVAKQRQKRLWPLVALIVTFGPLSMDALGSDGILELISDAPAVLDAPLTITAELVNAEDYRGPFYFTFSKLIYYFGEYSFSVAQLIF